MAPSLTAKEKAGCATKAKTKLKATKHNKYKYVANRWFENQVDPDPGIRKPKPENTMMLKS